MNHLRFHRHPFDFNTFIRAALTKSFPCLFVIAGFLLSVLFFMHHGKSIILADDSTEWLLADFLNKEGSFISKNWFYGTELHVFHSQILNRVFLSLFPDWYTARLFSLSLHLLLLAAAVLYLSRQLELGYFGCYAAGALMYPFSSIYSYFGIYSGFYIFYHILAFLILAFVIKNSFGSSTETPVHKAVVLFLSILLSFLAGLNGVRLLITLFIPLCITATCHILHECMNNGIPLKALLHKCKETLPLSCYLSSFACILGWLFNEMVLSKHFTYWTYRNNNLQSFLLTDFLNYLGRFPALLGYEGIYDFSSTSGMGQLLALATTAFLLLSAVYFIRHRILFSAKEQFFNTFALTAYIANSLIFYLGQQNETRFLLSSLCYSFLLVASVLKHIQLGRSSYIGFALSVIFMLCIAGQGYANTYAGVSDSDSETEESYLASWLTDHDYTYGMATFWNSANIEFLSNGRLSMWTCMPAGSSNHEKDSAQKPLITKQWESAKYKSMQYPEQNCFLIVSDSDTELIELTEDCTPVFSTGQYRVFDIDHPEEWLELSSSY